MPEWCSDRVSHEPSLQINRWVDAILFDSARVGEKPTRTVSTHTHTHTHQSHQLPQLRMPVNPCVHPHPFSLGPDVYRTTSKCSTCLWMTFPGP